MKKINILLVLIIGAFIKINAQEIFRPKSTLFSKFPKYLTFLMPFVFEHFDLGEYDVIISDGTA